MVTSITDVLNIWNNMGVFSYMIPFLLIFAVVFAILNKTKMLSSGDNDNRAIIAIIAASIGLLSLQFDFVSNFFAIIFPRFGVGLALFLVVLIFIGFFHSSADGVLDIRIAWVGWLVGIGVFIWSLSSWGEWSDQSAVGGWFVQNVWSLIVLGVLVAVIIAIVSSKKTVSNPHG